MKLFLNVPLYSDNFNRYWSKLFNDSTWQEWQFTIWTGKFHPSPSQASSITTENNQFPNNFFFLIISIQWFYNLFRLFFLASIFFLSATTFVVPSFLRAVAVVPPAIPTTAVPLTPVSVVGTIDCCSWLLPPFPDVVERTSGDSNGSAAPLAAFFWSTLTAEVLDWSTFNAVVDSQIAPDLNLGFGLAWIPV